MTPVKSWAAAAAAAAVVVVAAAAATAAAATAAAAVAAAALGQHVLMNTCHVHTSSCVGSDEDMQQCAPRPQVQ